MERKFNPWQEIISMRDKMDKIMNETMNFKMETRTRKNRLSLWQPLTDMFETDSHIVLEMELPGVFQENINLEIQGSQLVVYGEKKLEKEASGSAYQMLERSYGPFSRVFKLPENIDPSTVAAVYKNGTLRVSILKTDKFKKRVSISITGI
ncbi:MAG: Hsp20/alpha crystallin family protein [Desulfonatronovibrio sp.]